MSQTSTLAPKELRTQHGHDEDDHKDIETVFDANYYESNQYLSQIPKNNSRWIHAPLSISKEDDNLAASFADFSPTTTNDFHPYFQDISSAVDLFQKWSALPTITSQQESSSLHKAWKHHSTMNGNDAAVSLFTTDNGSITKTVSIFPFSSAILCGVLCNNEHYAAIDENILSCKVLDHLDDHSYTVFAECNRPFPFSKNPSLLMVRFCYILSNGQVLFGETSVDGGSFEADTRTKRAEMTSVWHIAPILSDHQRPQSTVTHYCQYRGAQFLHRKLEEKVIVEKGKFLWKLHRYLHEIRKLLHIEGQLHIPPVLFRLMDLHADSLSISSGESQDELGGVSPSITAENDHTILDLNLAFQTAIVDVKQLFQKIKFHR